MRFNAVLLAAAICVCLFAAACAGPRAELSGAETEDIDFTEETDMESAESNGSVSEEYVCVTFETGGKKYEAELNSAPSGDCVRIYDHTWGDVTPGDRDRDFAEIAVRDRTVVYTGQPNERLVILPDTYIISFCGSYVQNAAGISPGGKVIIKEGKVDTLYGDRAVIGGKSWRITGIDSERGRKSVVLYTPAFGTSTRTAPGGLEFAVADGFVVSAGTDGDTDIPYNGCVLSFGEDAPSPSGGETSAEIEVIVQNGKYETAVLNVDRYNDVRWQDFLVIYSGKSSSGTNPYGYEVQVDSEGVCVGEVYGGDAAIPKGGYVISGHGRNETALKAAYCYGAKAVLDRKNNTVTIIQTPLMEYESARALLAQAGSAFSLAEENFLDIDRAACGGILESARSLMAEAATRAEAEEYGACLKTAAKAKEALAELFYRLIPSKAVENRAAWYRPTEKSDGEVRALLEKARSMNINTLYIETWYYGYTIGYSSVPGVLHNPANGDYDALEGFCRIAKEYGIEIHAWVQNFCAGLTQQAASEPECLINTLPVSKRLIDRAGNDCYPLATGGFVFLDPYDPENRALVLAVYEELLANYDIDGIHLDYIRFPELNGENDYGYNDDIVNAFKDRSGYKGDLKRVSKESGVYRDFSAFRREIITSFVGEVYELVMRVKPDAWISVAAYPNTENAKNTIFQDVETWVNNGWIDEVFSMTYSADNAYVLSNAAHFAALTADKCFYSTGLDGYSGTRPEIFAYQFSAAREAGADGESLFAVTGKNSELWLRNSESYTRPVRLGAYSRPSVQTYLAGKTLIAQIDELFRKRDDVYGEAYVYGGLLDGALLALREKCSAFIGGSFAEEYSLETELSAALTELCARFGEFSDVREIAACRGDVFAQLEQMRSAASRSASRLKARLN